MFDDLSDNNQNSTAQNSGVFPNSGVKPETNQREKKEESNVKNKSDFAAAGNDLNKTNPRNKQERAEDMFAEIEPKPKPPVFEKKQADSGDHIEHYDEDGHNHQKIFFLVFIVLILILLGVGGVWAYNYFMERIDNESAVDIKEPEKTNQETGKEIKENNNQNNEEIESPAEDIQEDISEIEEKNAAPEELDSDGDGLTDEEEWRLGTAIDNVDTDNDGLFDREEVKVYKTNPRNPDTDGDGYIDGDEVDGGYNPLGSGRLLDIKK
ncbi:hypothetical protein KAU09_00905 [Candidatus Parcubacteria bacterium]|nr:hypothetical protein [Candidatus Parcubacteria bacterium]